jgi:hypothetical protein
MYYSENEIKKIGEDIKKCLLGLTKEEMEVLFEKYVLPIYTFTARRPNEDTKWKIINRQSDEIFESITTSEKLYSLINN